MAILVVDVGTSGVRAAIVQPDATVSHAKHREVLPTSPSAGLVEFDPAAMAEAALSVARAVLAEAGPVDAVGIANQRASTIVWDRSTGEPVGPGIGWQDLRTAGTCLMLQEQGVRLAPNVSATKAQYLFETVDPGRRNNLCFGTVDTWIAWNLSGGKSHITDPTNAALTGLRTADGLAWNKPLLELLGLPLEALPEVVASSGESGYASELDGSPPISGIAGDQQASLVGQGCVLPGLAKATFGTGGMLDLCLGNERPEFEVRGPGGTFPIVAWTRDSAVHWGVEAIMLAAGNNVEWLRDDLGMIETVAESHDVAASCDDSDGVMFVPALLGLGTPQWDYGARGTLLGLTRGSGKAQVVRAVLEGVAQRGADLVEAAETDGDTTIETLRIDGGMSTNPTFVQALANAIGRPVEVSPEPEATTLGAAFLAGMAIGTWPDEQAVADTWHPVETVEPTRQLDRERWRDAVSRAEKWVPELSALDF